MVERFWRIVNDWVGPALEGLSTERRAIVRFVTSVSLLGVIFSLALIPVAIIEGESPWLPLGISLAEGATLLVVRRPGGDVLASVVFLGVVFFLGVGVSFQYEQSPGYTNLSWLLFVGVAPALFRSRVWVWVSMAVAAIGAALVLSFPPPAVAAILTQPSDVIPVVLGTCLVVTLSLSIHQRARAEVQAKLTSAQAERRRLDAANATLEARSTETLAFMTTMSHELRTPLNGVLGLADLLTHEEVCATTHQRLDHVRSSGRAVLRAFNTLLFLVRTTAGQSPEPETIDLPGVLQAELSRAAHATMDRSDEDFELVAAPGLPRLAIVNSGALKALLGQLLGLVADSRAERVRIEAATTRHELKLRIVGEGTGAAELGRQQREEILEMGWPLASELARAVDGSCVMITGARGGEDLVIELKLPRGARPGQQPLGGVGERARERRAYAHA